VSQDSSNKSAFDEDGSRRTIIDSQNGKTSSGEMGGSDNRFIDGEEYSYRSSSLRFNFSSGTGVEGPGWPRGDPPQTNFFLFLF
jgi:hypothetical protein